MKKIAILAFGEKHGGGVYQYTQSFIDALKLDKSNEYIIFCDCDDRQFDDGLEVRKVSIPTTNISKKIIRVLQRLFLIRKDFFISENEILMFCDIDLFISPSSTAYPHFYINKPFIFTLHDMQERYYPNFFSVYERFLRWLNNRALAKCASQVICESEYVKKDIVKFIGVNENKINVIKSPPPEDFLNYQFDDNKFHNIRKKYNLPQKYIFYPAQCWFHKNHIELVRAFNIARQQYSDVELILTGSQQNNYRNLMQEINKLALNSSVKHLGYIDYDDLPYIYKMSQFLVMPTLFESVSIPIYEAFSLQVPVCCSNVVALPEQVGDAGLIFDALNINDMADKMMKYLDNENLRNEMAKKGHERVSDFNHKQYLSQLLKVLGNN